MIKDKNSLISILEWEDKFEKSETISNKEFYKGVKNKRAISLGELFRICYREKYDFNIYIVLPEKAFKKFKEPLVFFPQRLRFGTGKDLARSLEVTEPVLYKNKSYSFESIIEQCPPFKWEDCVYFKMPFLFFFWSPSFGKFRKIYLTNIRSYMLKQGGITETRGKKSKPKVSIYKDFIIGKYVSLTKQKRTLKDIVRIIIKNWVVHVAENPTKDPTDPNKNIEKPIPHESTVRRIIGEYRRQKKKTM